MKGRNLREALASGRRVYATSIVSSSPLWPPVVARAGVDFVFIDSEHIARDPTILSWMCRAYGAMGLPPIVRIPAPDPYQASHVLDGGAGGIIAPYVESAEQVRTLVGATKLRPLKGKRLAAALENAAVLEPRLKEYLENRNADVVLIVNIESVPALDNLDAILAVPGLDAILIGPHDLSCSLGIPEQYRDRQFDEAVRTIIGKARKNDIGVGIHFSDGLDLEIQWAEAGANLIVHSSDIRLFGETLQRDIAAIRKNFGDATVERREEGEVIV